MKKIEKAKKEKIVPTKKEKIFMIVNSLLIVAILGTYLGRAIYYYSYYEKVYNESSYSTLQQVLKEKRDLLEEKNGLFENEDGSFTYRNQPEDNYCMFANTLYRIVGIGADNTVRLISAEPVSLGTLYEGESFEETDMFCWLNKSTDSHSGVFESMLEMQSGLLLNAATCYVSVSDLTDVHCENTADVNAKITLLSVKEYLNAGGAESYLACGEDFWLCNQDEEGNYYYVNESGALGVQSSKAMAKGIRPVIDLNFSASASSGSGTKDDPYIIKMFTAEKIDETLPGDYVQYGDYCFRVNNIDDDGTVLIMDGLVEENGNTLLMKYGKKSTYSTSDGVGNYLNTTFLETLPNYEDVLVEHEYDCGTFSGSDDFSYFDSYQDTYSCYVGIPNTSFLFLNGYDNYYLCMNSEQFSNLIYTIKNYSLYADYITVEHAIRPVICMSNSIQIISGEGTKQSPYIINIETEELSDGQ